MRETRRNEEEELARQGKWTKEREEVGAGRERKVGTHWKIRMIVS